MQSFPTTQPIPYYKSSTHLFPNKKDTKNTTLKMAKFLFLRNPFLAVEVLWLRKQSMWWMKLCKRKKFEICVHRVFSRSSQLVEVRNNILQNQEIMHVGACECVCMCVRGKIRDNRCAKRASD